MTLETTSPLSLLNNNRLRVVIYREESFDWVFSFDDNVAVVAESSRWRLVGPDHVILTDEDHGQRFGRSTDVDAQIEVVAAVEEATVQSVSLRQPSRDLLISFTNGCTLEVLISSAGYENWHVYGPADSHTFAAGCGRIFGGST